jgi:hypothetical protein
MTASVVQNSTPVTAGTVTFCDATAPHCEGSAIFGTAQLTSAGTASIQVVLGVGTYSIEAIFQSRVGYPSSASTAQPLTVTGNASYPTGFLSNPTATGSVGDYTLEANLVSFGKHPPSGHVTFLDTTNGNLQVASATPDPATLNFFLSPFPYQLSVGNNPQAIVTGDLNNDGIPDIVVVNSSDNTVSVLLGTGSIVANGNLFMPQVTYATGGTTPTAVAIADMNGDGVPDLIVANYTSDCAPGTVSVLLGVGDGTFGQASTFAVGDGAEGVAIGDFNNDGNLDVAISNSNDNTVGILLGKGDGTFQDEVTWAVGNQPIGIVVADLNHDQNADIVVADNSDGTVSVLLGKGDGTFQPYAIYPVAAVAYALALGDFNGDGNLDLAVVEGQGTSVNVLLGNGDGSFQPQVAYPGGRNSQSVAVGDFNADGFTDIAMLDQGNGVANVSLLLGVGDGTFRPQTLYPAGSNLVSMAVADFDGEGLPDVATVSNSPNQVSVLFNFEGETATATGASVVGTGSHNVIARYAGDVTYTASQSGPVTLTGSGSVSTTTVITASPNPATASQLVTFTATVSPAPTSAGSTVDFFSGTTLLGIGTVNASGTATYSTSSFATGSYTITALYSGNAAFATSTSAGLAFTVSNAPSFSIAAPQTPVTVVAGGAAAFNLTVPPVGGAFNSPVTMSVSGLPTGATATFNPASVTPGSAGAPTTLTIQTSTQTASLPAQHKQGFLFAPLALAAGMCVLARKRKHLAKSLYILIAFATLAGGTLVLSGCSIGSASKPVVQPQSQTYVVTVTGTSGSQHASTTVTLIVQ